MVGYNLTGIVTNSTTILGFVQGVNDTLMLGWLGTLFLIGICVVSFTSFIYLTNDTNRAMAATSFIAFSLALLLRAISLISDLVLYITLIMAAVTIAFTWKKSSG